MAVSERFSTRPERAGRGVARPVAFEGHHSGWGPSAEPALSLNKKRRWEKVAERDVEHGDVLHLVAGGRGTRNRAQAPVVAHVPPAQVAAARRARSEDSEEAEEALDDGEDGADGPAADSEDYDSESSDAADDEPLSRAEVRRLAREARLGRLEEKAAAKAEAREAAEEEAEALQARAQSDSRRGRHPSRSAAARAQRRAAEAAAAAAVVQAATGSRPDEDSLAPQGRVPARFVVVHPANDRTGPTHTGPARLVRHHFPDYYDGSKGKSRGKGKGKSKNRREGAEFTA